MSRLSDELDKVVLAKSRVNFPGGQTRLDAAWAKYTKLKAALQKERASGHAEDIPPEPTDAL